MAQIKSSRASRTHTRIMEAARSLAAHKPLDRLGLSEVAREAGVSWPTAKRHLGSREELRQLLVTEQPELAHALPDTRSRLLDAAARVFARNGYEGATLDEIAKVAELTKGAVYWHFDAKREVFDALLDEYQSRREVSVQQDVEEAAALDDPEQAWGQLIRLQLMRAKLEPEWSRLLVEFVSRVDRGPSGASLPGVLALTPGAVTELARRLKARGRLPADADPHWVGVVVGALIHGLLVTCTVDAKSVDPDTIAGAAARLLARGLCT